MAYSTPEPDLGKLFASVGHALSTWEWLEMEMARLYSHFVKEPDQLNAITRFGRDNTITRARINKLEEAGARYFFAALGDQSREFMLRDLIGDIRAILHTRHRVAHGFVQPILTIHADGITADVHGHLLLSPTYAIESLRGQGDDYGYNCADLAAFAGQFWALRERLRIFCEGLYEQPSPHKQP